MLVKQFDNYWRIATFLSSQKNLISPPILDPSACEGKCQLAEVSLHKHVYLSNYEARCFDVLSRGSISGPKVDANN